MIKFVFGRLALSEAGELKSGTQSHGPQNSPTATGLDAAECWSVLERVATSSLLKRSSRLRDFLYYVGDKSLNKGCADIHEQEIGHKVFGRQEFYDTSQDNIVRVNATELRKRVDSYFSSENPGEPVIFEIPRGSYAPVFRLRAEPQQEEKDTQPAEAERVHPPSEKQITKNSSWLKLSLLLTSVAVIVLAVLSVTLWRQNQSMHRILEPWRAQPALARFWSGFLGNSRETDIILGDTSFALIEDITQQPYSLSDYLNRSYIRKIQAPSFSADRRSDLSLIVARPNGSVEDFQVAERIQALDPVSNKLYVQFAREYTADAIKKNNVILIGGQKSNPWVHLFLNQLNFVIQYDSSLRQSSILNRDPKPGEQAKYSAPVDPYASNGYGIIAFLPNPSHTANALIIAGTDSEATNAAGEFITSNSSVEKLLQKLHTTKLPYFEVLLKTKRLSGTPFSAQLLAYRTY